jgi:hypothetical protein
MWPDRPQCVSGDADCSKSLTMQQLGLTMQQRQQIEQQPAGHTLIMQQFLPCYSSTVKFSNTCSNLQLQCSKSGAFFTSGKSWLPNAPSRWRRCQRHWHGPNTPQHLMPLGLCQLPASHLTLTLPSGKRHKHDAAALGHRTALEPLNTSTLGAGDPQTQRTYLARSERVQLHIGTLSPTICR